ncbi:L,D-transpeptidase family protein (plasmid) [Novosphingobium resinovorum]|uniref:Peptidoglycan-binding protein n=1 Tax=Novosphingobium resinovorum TaxID=158500 RepID=A0A1D8AFV2_9SPHN|nr:MULTISPECIES: L,D-transpeptidase family protein [Novosphingobium]AOR80985.1 peptidoglycan-binding protein [Novosphingobium resinovorum]MBF7015485.1 L,D-transpeptidase family protein [Novosphingobium sp. HR1a]WJM30161.1 L,D-transpeptidase family protein [Novosphingobium resinovorum]
MRNRLIVSPLLAVTVALTACGSGSGTPDAPAPAVSITEVHWNDAAVRDLRAAIDSRATHGLDHMNFSLDGRPGNAEGDRALTESALRYASALARGASDPKKLYDIYSVPRPDPNLLPGLAKALKGGDLKDWLDGLAPRDDGYQRLSKAYLSLRGSRDALAPAIAQDSEPLKPGDSDRRVPQIARQLAASDYLDGKDAQGDRYSPAMMKAVQRMQADYGIKPDGVIGKDALEILNLSDADKARAIAVAMERMRWLQRDPPKTRIDVNVAAGRLTYWRDGKMVDTRKVVVGKPENQTPQLGSPIYRLVANPTWTVPRSIQSKEIAGKGSAYLRRNNMAWKDGWVVQQPGPRNSLGLVKFDMKNEHQIYLHDTPAKQLFQEVQRQRSHGCVRVEDAMGFAEMLARDEGVLDEWHRARATGKETFVPLPREIPVRLLYDTVLFGEDGEPVIRSDPYGRNESVATALGFAAGTSHPLHANGGDVGP